MRVLGSGSWSTILWPYRRKSDLYLIQKVNISLASFAQIHWTSRHLRKPESPDYVASVGSVLNCI